MILGKYLPTVLLGFAVLFNFEDCTNRSSDSSENNLKNAKRIISGNFSSELPKTPGFIKLEIKESGAATLLNVATLHLPPVELERLETKMSYQGDALCFETKPKSVEQCLVSANDQEITVKLVSDGTQLKLKKVEQ